MSVDPSTIEAAALAEVTRRAVRRAPWFRDEPLAVEPELYQRAQAELESILRDRGWPLRCAPLPEPNFLLHGIPIVMAA